MDKRRRGRPEKLTPEIQSELAKYIAMGHYLDTAAQLAGIHRNTVNLWLKRGRKESKGKYHDFLVAIKRALAEAEKKDVDIINSAASSGIWQAAAWKLERRYPDRWGRKDRLNLNTNEKVKKIIEIEVVDARNSPSDEDAATDPGSQ